MEENIYKGCKHIIIARKEPGEIGRLRRQLNHCREHNEANIKKIKKLKRQLSLDYKFKKALLKRDKILYYSVLREVV